MTKDGHPGKPHSKRLLGLLSVSVVSLAASIPAGALEPPEPARIMLSGYQDATGYTFEDTSCEPAFQGGYCDNYCMELWANYCHERPQRRIRSPRQYSMDGNCHNGVVIHGYPHAYCDAGSQCAPPGMTFGRGITSSDSAVGGSIRSQQPQVATPPHPHTQDVVAPTRPQERDAPAPPSNQVVPVQSLSQPLPPEPDDIDLPRNTLGIPVNPLPDTSTLPSTTPSPHFKLDPSPQSETQPRVPTNVLPNAPPTPEDDDTGPLDTSWRQPSKNRQAISAPPEPRPTVFRSASGRGNPGTTRLLRQLNGN